jgi:hypothetical protein
MWREGGREGEREREREREREMLFITSHINIVMALDLKPAQPKSTS